jgi:phosphoribosylanthranilate isomerase
MKAIAVAARGDLGAVPAYAAVADRLLFDGRAPREATRPGGLGKTFDWRLLENLDPGVPFMLSGGLDAGNVADALRITRAPAVDVSSGVERALGEKDPDKIRAFIHAAREPRRTSVRYLPVFDRRSVTLRCERSKPRRAMAGRLGRILRGAPLARASG